MQNERIIGVFESINTYLNHSSNREHLDPMMRFGKAPQNLSKKKLDLLKETLKTEVH